MRLTHEYRAFSCKSITANKITDRPMHFNVEWYSHYRPCADRKFVVVDLQFGSISFTSLGLKAIVNSWLSY